MIDEDELRTRLREPLRRLAATRPPLERTARRARVLRARRSAVMTISALILVAGVGVPLWSLSSVHGNARHVLGAGQDYGIHLEVPPDWDRTVSYRSTDLGPEVWASSTALPDRSAAPYLLAAIRGLGHDDVLLSLHEFGGAWPGTG